MPSLTDPSLEFTGRVSPDDILLMTDVSDTSETADGTTVAPTVNQLIRGLPLVFPALDVDLESHVDFWNPPGGGPGGSWNNGESSITWLRVDAKAISETDLPAWQATTPYFLGESLICEFDGAATPSPVAWTPQALSGTTGVVEPTWGVGDWTNDGELTYGEGFTIQEWTTATADIICVLKLVDVGEYRVFRHSNAALTTGTVEPDWTTAPLVGQSVVEDDADPANFWVCIGELHVWSAANLVSYSIWADNSSYELPMVVPSDFDETDPVGQFVYIPYFPLLIGSSGGGEPDWTLGLYVPDGDIFWIGEYSVSPLYATFLALTNIDDALEDGRILIVTNTSTVGENLNVGFSHDLYENNGGSLDRAALSPGRSAIYLFNLGLNYWYRILQGDVI